MKEIDNNREKDPFSRIIRDKLANYSVPIEAGSWEELEQRLNTSSRKKIPLWPWLPDISIAAAVALALLLSYHTKDTHPDSPPQVANLGENVPGVTSVPIQPAQPYAGGKKVAVPALAFHDEPERGIEEQTVPTETEITEKEDIQPKETSPSRLIRPLEVFPNEEPVTPPRKKRRKNGSFGFHISSGGGLYASNNSLSTINSDYLYIPALNYSPKFTVKAPEALNNDLLRIPDDFGKISHRPPVSVGWSVRKTLTDYLSIESGITYTYLYSTFENTFPRGDASLALHYLGIPVNLVVDLLPHSRKWNFYFSAGGMGEKGLLSHAVQNTYSPGSDEIVNTNVSNQKISGIQWSVQAALGVSYPFSRTYSLFIEPKISYYLENNQPFNVRTERPFVPGVTVGIRHTW